MPTQVRADLVGGGLLAALGVAVAVASAGYGLFGDDGGIAPGFVPFLSGVLLIGFGSAVAVQAWATRRRTPPAASDDATAGDDAAAGDEHQARAVATVFALTLGALLLASVVGFLVSFAVLMFLLVAVVERRGVVPALAVSVGATVTAWLMFVRFLNIPLPEGLL
ncbi:MAG: tripartite tricarboxylate transporter TctB family protein [Egibacteraceae bacterium]